MFYLRGGRGSRKGSEVDFPSIPSIRCQMRSESNEYALQLGVVSPAEGELSVRYISSGRWFVEDAE